DREQGSAGAWPRRAGRLRAADVMEGRERRRAASSGRRARLSREGVDEIAADWVFTNGRILTLDRARPTAGALAVQGGRVGARGGPPVRGGRVVAVGGPRDVRGWRDRRSRVIDLRGATVIPGLVDAHAHMDREG